jgi:diguanylate cyclase (GGDEF)-like protein
VVRSIALPTSERFTVTAEIAAAITSSLVLDEVLASVARRSAESLDLWECDIYEYRSQEGVTVGQAMWAREPHPGDADWVDSRETLVGQPTFRRVLTERHTIANHVDDPDLPPADRARMEWWGEKSCLLVPMIFKGEVIGCLELIEKRRPHHFTAEEVELAETLASLAAIAIQNARLYGSVERLAITDGLTGLYNHRHFYDRLAQEVARAQRYDLPLSLLMIDIDDFKRFNDRAGHPAGDALLRDVAGLLVAQTRQQVDLVARYGGEEFAVILPSTGAQGASRAGERLCDSVRSSGIELALGGRQARPEPAGTLVAAGSEGACGVGERIRQSVADETFGLDEPPPVVTVSVGVATLPDHATTVDTLVEQADRGLYLAKSRGKNRVEAAPGD